MVDAEEVRRVAALAALAVPEEDVPRLAEEMARILEHVRRLEEVDVRDVPPTPSALVVPGVVREDVPMPSLPPEAALRNAPRAQAGMFLVPRVVDAGT